MGPRVPFVPLPFGNLTFLFCPFEHCLFNFVYVYICMYVVRFPIKSTKQNKEKKIKTRNRLPQAKFRIQWHCSMG